MPFDMGLDNIVITNGPGPQAHRTGTLKDYNLANTYVQKALDLDIFRPTKFEIHGTCSKKDLTQLILIRNESKLPYSEFALEIVSATSVGTGWPLR